MFRSLQTVFIVTLLLCTVACSSSSSDGDGTTPGSDGGAVTPPVIGGNTDGTTGANPPANGGGNSGDAESALSHVGVKAAKGPEPAANDPLVSSVGRSQAAALSEPLGVVIEAVENHSSETGVNCKQLGAEYASCSVVNLHIKDANGVLAGNDWKIYSHSIRRVLRVDSDNFDVSLINGDLNYISPSDNYQPFAGDVATIKLITEFNYLMETDFMPRFWLVQNNGTPELLPNTDSETNENTYAVEITGLNAKAWNTEPNPLATAATRFQSNQDVQNAAAALTAADIQRRVVPQVSSITPGNGVLSIANGLNFTDSGLSAASAAAVQQRANLFVGI